MDGGGCCTNQGRNFFYKLALLIRKEYTATLVCVILLVLPHSTLQSCLPSTALEELLHRHAQGLVHVTAADKQACIGATVDEMCAAFVHTARLSVTAVCILKAAVSNTIMINYF